MMCSVVNNRNSYITQLLMAIRYCSSYLIYLSFYLFIMFLLQMLNENEKKNMYTFWCMANHRPRGITQVIGEKPISNEDYFSPATIPLEFLWSSNSFGEQEILIA